jgi:hypothetical protein
MNEREGGRRPVRHWLVPALLLGAAGTVAAWYGLSGDDAPPPPPAYPKGSHATVTETEVRHFCGACHAFPPPDCLPRRSWKHVVDLGYMMATQQGMKLAPPARAAVTRFFEERAPEELPPPPRRALSASPPVRFEVEPHAVPGLVPHPAVANVNLVHLFDARRPDILVCDMRHGRVLAFSPYAPQRGWRVLGEVPHPAHAEVVDLDGDGIKDILVASLGNFYPTDDKVGSVVWLRGQPDRTFRPVTLLSGVGRVADVQAADFDGDGKLDLLVAVFGWRATGEIRLLRNRTTDWAKPQFDSEVLDYRHGAIHVPVADLNGDGKPDFVALISQEHETVTAFFNEGGGRFRKEILFEGPHPAFGSSGIQVVDLNGDGRWDVLYTNGDALDLQLLKPYHAIWWLENRGTFPFTAHRLAVLPGAHRAVAADFRGRGRLDIFAVAYLPWETVVRVAKTPLDSVLYLEQVEPGRFVTHCLEQGSCDHATCVAGDLDGDGRPDVVVGNFGLRTERSLPAALTVWKNLGPPRTLGRPGR